MRIKFYNYFTHKKQVFAPLKKGFVSIYSCGPTVYNFVHLGNLRTYIFSDILCRMLRFNGFRVRQVMNITDVEDKIIKNIKSDESLKNLNWKEKIKKFTGPYVEKFLLDIKSLNISRAHVYPRATDNIKMMLKIIGILIDKKYAYIVSDGIYFDIKKFKKYGKLSGLKKRQLKSGARVNADEYEKVNVSDFALWKFSGLSDGVENNEPLWESVWGAGRPGWHIECAAMSFKYLGCPFDIHTGAIDLLFPHHENEIAEAEAAFSKKFTNYFMEGEHLLVDGNKMAKSLGNTFSLEDVRKKGFDPASFRYLCLSCHYRNQMNFTWTSLESAFNSLNRLRSDIINMAAFGNKYSQGGVFWEIPVDSRGIVKDKKIGKISAGNSLIKKYKADFVRCINDDLDLPKAVAIFYKVFSDKNIAVEGKLPLLLEFDRILGLGLEYYYEIGISKNKDIEKLKPLIEKRDSFRKKKLYQEADGVRMKIKEAGYDIEDTEGGVIVKILKNG